MFFKGKEEGGRKGEREKKRTGEKERVREREKSSMSQSGMKGRNKKTVTIFFFPNFP